MDKIKSGIAKNFNKYTRPITLPVMILSGVMGNILVDNSFHEIDSYTNSDTVEKVEYFESRIAKLNTDFINNKNVTNQLLFQENSAKEALELEALNASFVETANKEIKDLEYSLLFSGISEQDVIDITYKFNEMEISSESNLIRDYRVNRLDALNDVISDNNRDQLISITTAEDREKRINDIYSGIRDKAFLEGAVKTLGSVVSFFLPLIIIASISTSGKLKEWKNIEPTNRRRKKLKPASKDNNPKSLN